MTPTEAVARYGSQSKAADAIGMGRTKFREVYKLSQFQQQGSNLPPPVGTSVEPPNPAPSIQKPRISIRADMPTTRVLCIGDTHDSPKLPDKSRFKWIARHAASTRPDQIVHIGDLGDWHSCSRHEVPGSSSYARKPSFREDMESCEEALTLVYKEIGSDIPLRLVAGNHEGWIQKFEEANPALEGGFYQQFLDMMARFGWKVSDFGEWHFIDSVGFVHIPLNLMGKPYGGKNSANAIGNDAVHSVVHGHDHRLGFRCVPKIGYAKSIEILDLGSAMPKNYVAEFAKIATTGWTYGIFDIEISCGHITSHSFIDMAELERRYGD